MTARHARTVAPPTSSTGGPAVRSSRSRLRNTAAATAVAAALAIGVTAVEAPAPLRAVAEDVKLAATYLLKPTQIPLLKLSDAENEFIADPWITSIHGSVPLPQTVVDYPATVWPVSGLRTPTFDQSIDMGVAELKKDVAGDPAPVIFGYSQGATVGTVYKRDFNEQYANAAPGAAIPTPTFIFIGNPDRPNGGVLMRFAPTHVPIIDLTFEGATPTETAGAAPGQVTTYDIARQYDFFADYPTYPLKPIALANAVMGLVFEHLFYFTVDMNDAVSQGQYGDTAYYLIPTERLPLLEPLALLGVPDPILAALDAPLRVLVESAYDRTISPGEPTKARWIPINHPRQTLKNFIVAIPTGWDDGLEEMGLGRPFGTTPAGPYGVGGPPVDVTAAPVETSSATTNQPLAKLTDTVKERLPNGVVRSAAQSARTRLGDAKSVPVKPGSAPVKPAKRLAAKVSERIAPSRPTPESRHSATSARGDGKVGARGGSAA